MKILIACEESQAITKELRKLGHEAYSCDLLPCSGGHPEWHIQGDAIKEAYSGKWEMMIAHPPCTYLAVSGNRWLYNKDGSKNEDRWKNRREALDFVQLLMDAPIDKISIAKTPEERRTLRSKTFMGMARAIANQWTR